MKVYDFIFNLVVLYESSWFYMQVSGFIWKLMILYHMQVTFFKSKWF